MATPATVTLNRRAIESLIEQLIELLDTADANAAIDADKTAQDDER